MSTWDWKAQTPRPQQVPPSRVKLAEPVPHAHEDTPSTVPASWRVEGELGGTNVAVVEIDSQELREPTTDAVTQMDRGETEPGVAEGIHFDVMGDTEMAMLDQIMAEEDALETHRQAQREYDRYEAFLSQEAEQAGQWLDEFGVETANRRAQEAADKARRDAESRTARLAQEEVDVFNRRASARRYRDWEEWVVLNTEPGPGHTSRQREGTTTQIEALVRQEGATVGKRARWNLPLHSSRSFVLQFEVGVMGEAGDPVNVKRGAATTPVDRGGQERRAAAASGAPVDLAVGDAGPVADGGEEGPTMTMENLGQNAGDLASTTWAQEVDGKVDTTGQAKEEVGVDAEVAVEMIWRLLHEGGQVDKAVKTQWHGREVEWSGEVGDGAFGRSEEVLRGLLAQSSTWSGINDAFGRQLLTKKDPQKKKGFGDLKD